VCIYFISIKNIDHSFGVIYFYVTQLLELNVDIPIYYFIYIENTAKIILFLSPITKPLNFFLVFSNISGNTKFNYLKKKRNK